METGKKQFTSDLTIGGKAETVMITALLRFRTGKEV